MFNLNEKVQWSSQAGGKTTTKTGIIVRILQPGEALEQLPNGTQFDNKGPRNVVNYLVQVGSKLYRPLTIHLTALASEVKTA